MSYLVELGLLSHREQSTAFLQAFNALLSAKIELRLQIQFPDCFAHSLAAIYEAAQWTLRAPVHFAIVTSPVRSPANSIATRPLEPTEDALPSISTIPTSLPRVLAFSPSPVLENRSIPTLAPQDSVPTRIDAIEEEIQSLRASDIVSTYLTAISTETAQISTRVTQTATTTTVDYERVFKQYYFDNCDCDYYCDNFDCDFGFICDLKRIHSHFDFCEPHFDLFRPISAFALHFTRHAREPDEYNCDRANFDFAACTAAPRPDIAFKTRSSALVDPLRPPPVAFSSPTAHFRQEAFEVEDSSTVSQKRVKFHCSLLISLHFVFFPFLMRVIFVSSHLDSIRITFYITYLALLLFDFHSFRFQSRFPAISPLALLHRFHLAPLSLANVSYLAHFAAGRTQAAYGRLRLYFTTSARSSALAQSRARHIAPTSRSITKTHCFAKNHLSSSYFDDSDTFWSFWKWIWTVTAFFDVFRRFPVYSFRFPSLPSLLQLSYRFRVLHVVQTSYFAFRRVSATLRHPCAQFYLTSALLRVSLSFHRKTLRFINEQLLESICIDCTVLLAYLFPSPFSFDFRYFLQIPGAPLFFRHKPRSIDYTRRLGPTRTTLASFQRDPATIRPSARSPPVSRRFPSFRVHIAQEQLESSKNAF